MAVYDNSYSRFIAWAKVILPLFALAILSTLFLFSNEIDPGDAIPYSDVDVSELAREQGVGAPNFAGVTEDGAAISVVALKAQPDPDNAKKVTARDLSATIEPRDGVRMDLSSDRGAIDLEAQAARFEGDVKLSTADGYQITTEALIAALDRTDVTSENGVIAKAPMGTLEAGQMQFRQERDADGAYVLVFKKGVKLIYQPTK